MAEDHGTHLDMSTRIRLGREMMRSVHERGWGRVTELAQAYGLSCTWLYEWEACTKTAFETALQPGRAG